MGVSVHSERSYTHQMEEHLDLKAQNGAFNRQLREKLRLVAFDLRRAASVKKHTKIGKRTPPRVHPSVPRHESGEKRLPVRWDVLSDGRGNH